MPPSTVRANGAAHVDSAALKERALALGFVACGVSSADEDTVARFIFQQRIDLGMYEGLPWFTRERAERATHPARSLAGAASVVTFAAPYRTEYVPDQALGGLRGRVARYAWGRDYHRVLEKKLRSLVAFVEAEYGARARGMVDYGPLAERAYAARAGIGWFGKNTNLLLPGIGSWVLLAELVTTVPFAPDPSLAKSCGACTRCVAACPTGAISAEYVVDNQRCISFQTIENRGWIPVELRSLLGDWVFGCDLCQESCPVGSSRGPVSLPEFTPADTDAALPELTALLELDEARFVERFRGRAIMRAKRAGLARNACVALGNLGNPAAVPSLGRALREDPSPIVRGHAAWALGRIGGEDARTALDAAQNAEKDAVVLGEIDAAIAGSVPAADSSGTLHDAASWLAGPWSAKRTTSARPEGLP